MQRCGWDVYRSKHTATVACLHKGYQVLFQPYSDSHHNNAVINIIHFVKYDRKDHLLKGEQWGSTGLSTGNKFQSPEVALGNFGVDFTNCRVHKHHISPFLFSHNVQMFSYICAHAGFSQGWGHCFRQAPTFTHKCLLFVLQHEEMMPQMNSRAHWVVQGVTNGMKPQCPFPDKLSKSAILEKP